MTYYSETYADTCKYAATVQGLDPVTERLSADSIAFEVEQTGGFTMVVSVPVSDGTICVTADSPHDDRPYLVGFYPGDTWQDGVEDESYAYVAIADLTLVIREHL